MYPLVFLRLHCWFSHTFPSSKYGSTSWTSLFLLAFLVISSSLMVLKSIYVPVMPKCTFESRPHPSILYSHILLFTLYLHLMCTRRIKLIFPMTSLMCFSVSPFHQLRQSFQSLRLKCCKSSLIPTSHIAHLSHLQILSA